jgi:hypothetical protein
MARFDESDWRALPGICPRTWRSTKSEPFYTEKTACPVRTVGRTMKRRILKYRTVAYCTVPGLLVYDYITVHPTEY